MLFKVPGSRDELRPTLNIELSMYTYCLRSQGSAHDRLSHVNDAG
jgi:hypothetical protein